jgi:hypothetical protein
MISLLTKLGTWLSKSIDAYETFCLSFRDLFEDPSVQGHELLQAIDVSFNRLRLKKKNLESLVDRSSNFARMVRLPSPSTWGALANILPPRSKNLH